uniref:Mitochondrial import inner membrane translocase subunit n=1 Tax=Urocitellus parryii TaxID=9999 RepID=A0A8D2H8M6_UROPR
MDLLRAQQLATELEVEMMVDMHNRMTSACHQKCVSLHYDMILYLEDQKIHLKTARANMQIWQSSMTQSQHSKINNFSIYNESAEKEIR